MNADFTLLRWFSYSISIVVQLSIFAALREVVNIALWRLVVKRFNVDVLELDSLFARTL
jgi:hypothetical protein